MSHEIKNLIPEELKAGVFKGHGIFDFGEENVAYADYFTGTSYLALLNKPGLIVANVTFEPGCRNFWHIHHLGGQILLVTGGRGWYQEAGKAARALHPGDVVHIAPGTKHWHGAAKDSWFAHVAIEIPAEGASNEWCEPVSDEEYNALN
ncbi:cupin domain-containing protein [Photobacterium sp. CCB-ST2H9]|uniref:cupin domain-containing protein n=1 Tax=Photobacterium sp. CCB-ST2H9 TaxID=2912855 RepID=UPI0020043351|nr:cupin domain-containing protein [Photobacterium sp. CCB-ST2H9]UTM58688.1 cupin domain-containing protein [Photobacterium sp. CCB-ST2H9]